MALKTNNADWRILAVGYNRNSSVGQAGSAFYIDWYRITSYWCVHVKTNLMLPFESWSLEETTVSSRSYIDSSGTLRLQKTTLIFGKFSGVKIDFPWVSLIQQWPLRKITKVATYSLTWGNSCHLTLNRYRDWLSKNSIYLVQKQNPFGCLSCIMYFRLEGTNSIFASRPYKESRFHFTNWRRPGEESEFENSVNPSQMQTIDGFSVSIKWEDF